jgi:hypothetical protein
MTRDNTDRSVLLIGRSQRVLDETVAGLHELGYKAEATNDFADVTGRFDARKLNVVVFGGQVPPQRRAELNEEIRAINPQIMFVQGLAGIPGLIVNQVNGAFAARQLDPTAAPTITHQERSIRLTLPDPADVKVSVWWGTSFVPPDPKSDSLVLLDERLARGNHTIPIPDHIPLKVAFATVQVDATIHAFSIDA